jgi:hypothetical protein
VKGIKIMFYNDFKARVTKSGNKNFNIVRGRASHNCKYCNSIIRVGEESLTINPRRGSRYWCCKFCVEKMLDIANAKSTFNYVAFDDEGYYLACQDWLEEATSALYK